ncbi:MAG: nitrite reductase [Candidatus Kapaibacterium sp.]
MKKIKLPKSLSSLFNTRKGRIYISLLSLSLLLVIFSGYIYNKIFEAYTGVTNSVLSYENSIELSELEFEELVEELTREQKLQKAGKVIDADDNFTNNVRTNILMRTRSFNRISEYKHIEYFRKAGIRKYDGPSTCLQCHTTMKVIRPDGKIDVVNTLDDVLNTVHFQFQTSSSGFTTYGYDGRKVNEGWHKIPVGKIDRACGIPGSFSWTGWASLIKTYPEYHGTDSHKTLVMRSEGCGQCHIGGNYHPATEYMMPIGDIPWQAKEGVDCLICHSQSYDMNQKFVIKDDGGTRWNQDRSLRAALTVGKPRNENCLNCHQHNMGGDLYEHNISAKNLGYKNQRILHEGAKRGNPFSIHNDVHYKAGLICTDCHIPQGHKIPRGTKGTDLVGNDLPDVEVACENCHTDAPHTKDKKFRVILNGHVNRIACETCHITNLEDRNVVLRDWVHPTYNSEEGIWSPTDIYRSGNPGKGFTYLWFNGNGTFLANALGSNPNGSKSYNPLMNQLVKIYDPEIINSVRKGAEDLKKIYPDIDVNKYVNRITNTLSGLSSELLNKRRKMIEENIRPLMNQGKSKIYPFKLFNAQMYEDMTNQGPYGAMILPFDYAVYYQTGNTTESVKKAIANPIVKRMYEMPFKYYMMDEFMYYFGVDGWQTVYPLKDGKLYNVEPQWMRQFGTLMVNHGITGKAHKCEDCHSPNGIMDFKMLGYDSIRVNDLQYPEELKNFQIQ